MRIGFVAAVFLVANSIGAPLAWSASSTLVGTAAIQHCGKSDGLSIDCRDDDAVQLRFVDRQDQSIVSIDFVLRGKTALDLHRTVEIFVSAPHRIGSGSSELAFQWDRRPRPLATNIDARGVSKSVMALEDFVNFAMTSTLEGSAFGAHFVATKQQMLTLRLAAGRWAAYGPTSN